MKPVMRGAFISMSDEEHGEVIQISQREGGLE